MTKESSSAWAFSKSDDNEEFYSRSISFPAFKSDTHLHEPIVIFQVVLIDIEPGHSTGKKNFPSAISEKRNQSIVF